MIPGWLVHGDLPPAGNRVVLGCGAPPEFPGYRAHWVQSGTAALALGLAMARARQPAIAQPTAILPAYGCPDLIAAAVYAGVQPRLVDIGASDPGYDLEKLALAIDHTTVAVVAVNFLGIRERLQEVRSCLAQYPAAMLIEDNAQWFPEPVAAPALAGDLVCLSFGRGKPVSLLGGGALLVRDGCTAPLPPIAPANESGRALALKVAAFNALLNRRLYPLVNRNPCFELGKTVYKPLAEIRALDPQRVQSIGPAARCYLGLSRRVEMAWDELFSERALAVSAAARRGRLLRYPILCRDARERDALWRLFERAGLGASSMYRVALPEVAGVEGKFTAGDYANARAFAARLLTLPVHEGVATSDIARVAALIKQAGLILRK